MQTKTFLRDEGRGLVCRGRLLSLRGRQSPGMEESVLGKKEDDYKKGLKIV